MGLSLHRRRKRNQGRIRGGIVGVALVLAYLSFFASEKVIAFDTRIAIERLAPWVGFVFWVASAFWVAGLPDRDADGTLHTSSWVGRLLFSALALAVLIAAVAVSFSIIGLAFVGIPKM